jgi:hypothetical protein
VAEPTVSGNFIKRETQQQRLVAEVCCLLRCDAIHTYNLRVKESLTLSALAQYMYSAASHVSCPNGVLVFHDFHKAVK